MPIARSSQIWLQKKIIKIINLVKIFKMFQSNNRFINAFQKY
jgi:hypothetical protein